LATNHTEPLILHWSLAKKAGEWTVKLQNLFHFLKLQTAVLNTVISANTVLFNCAGTSFKYIAIWFQIARQGV
jgi:hypothetical protein